MLPWLEIIASGLKFKACARLEWHVFFPALNWHRWPTKRLLQTWLSNLEGARCIRPWKDETHVLACEEILAISWLCVCLFHCFMNYQAMTADSGGHYLSLKRQQFLPHVASKETDSAACGVFHHRSSKDVFSALFVGGTKAIHQRICAMPMSNCSANQFMNTVLSSFSPIS